MSAMKRTSRSAGAGVNLLANTLHDRRVDALQLMGLPGLLASQGREQLALLREGRVEVCGIGGGVGAQPVVSQHQVAARGLC